MRKHLAAFAFLSALAIPGAAHATVTINFGPTIDIPGINDFETELLNDYGVTQYASLGSSITVDANTAISFFFLGSESGYSDSFAAPGAFYSEANSFIDSFATPQYIGGGLFTAGTDLAGLLNFTSSGGAAATVGQAGFGIFLGPNAVSGTSVSQFVFGYDDQVTNPDDDNHDDLIVLAQVHAVPEPATWAMMLLGFGGIGAAMRRKRAVSRAALAAA